MIIFIVLVIVTSGESFHNQRSHHVRRRFFNEMFKRDSTFFKLEKQPKYSSQDKWVCADGRTVLIKDILKGNVFILYGRYKVNALMHHEKRKH